MEPGLLDHFRPLAVVDLEVVGERDAASAEHAARGGIDQSRVSAARRNAAKLDAGTAREQFGGEMRDGPDARRRREAGSR